MAYRDFTLDDVREKLGVRAKVGTVLPPLSDVAPPTWLADSITRAGRLLPASEKGRSELYVAPVLLAARDVCGESFTIFSGHRFNVEPNRGLVGVCDFILARMEPAALPQAPILMIAEAKRGILERGMGQCIAEMVAARTFNEREGTAAVPIYGCVTSGLEWMFLRLDGETAVYQVPIPLAQLGQLLAAFKYLLTPPA